MSGFVFEVTEHGIARPVGPCQPQPDDLAVEHFATRQEDVSDGSALRILLQRKDRHLLAEKKL
jgi:hypothetical protein